MKKQLICSLLVLFAFAGIASAQDLERDPGYVDLADVEGWFDVEPKVIVNIRGGLLNLVAEASRYEDPELSNLLQELSAIQVRGFDLRHMSYSSVESRMTEMARSLESKGWYTVVRVRETESDERVDIFVRERGNTVAGMMVMVIDPTEDETFFVNIVGNIDPEQIGRIGRKFDIKPLDGAAVDYK